MRAIIQRVTHCSVTIDQQLKSQIENGLLVLLGIEETDNETDIEWLVKKSFRCGFSLMKTAK